MQRYKFLSILVILVIVAKANTGDVNITGSTHLCSCHSILTGSPVRTTLVE
jgi:hypothetical protein